MRILALDWGEVRIGGAVSDPTGMIAFPLEKFISAKNAIEEIKKIESELGIEKIVIGLPKNLSGASGISADKVNEFVQKLKKQVTSEIELLDERFSSVEAEKKLASAGINEEKQRTIKDNIAAQIILQSYLDKK
ncbi:MAG: Holliday junction resolvase RuvX [Candidatus Doudnabacteria bacterium]|nr:Holliday junction resolvase RuvX [Candidatus Doudnabacteria bacterium]